jgi:prepilin-type N-terminal cleavage/methylation domain-containing protein
MFPKNRAFSLIELIVVVAIIGILSLIVFSVVKISMDQSADAKIKANLNEAIIHAKLFVDKNGYASKANSGCSPSYTDTSYCACYGNGETNDNVLASIYNYTWNAHLVSDSRFATNGGISNTYVATCGSNAPYDASGNRGSWVVSVPLKSQDIISPNSGTDYYCVDYTLEEGKVIDTITEMTGEVYGEVASCG